MHAPRACAQQPARRRSHAQTTRHGRGAAPHCPACRTIHKATQMLAADPNLASLQLVVMLQWCKEEWGEGSFDGDGPNPMRASRT